MKRFLHTPGLLLIAILGLICIVLGLESAEAWCRKEYLDLLDRCK